MNSATLATGIAARLAAALAAFTAATLLAACGASTDSGVRRGEVNLAECRLKDMPAAAWCAKVAVPEDPAKADGRKIDIHIAVLPAYTRTRAPDPLILLAGGPGQSASDLGKVTQLFDAVRRSRDIVLVDQRGAGRSHPFNCKLFDTLDPVAAMMQLDPDPAAIGNCASSFDGDPRLYTTLEYLADLEAVRKAIGADRYNLWGGSYGTRVALAYMAKHPQSIRSAIIDGVAPTSMRILFDGFNNGQAQLARTIADCQANAACAAAYPKLAEDWTTLTQTYATPKPMTLIHPRTGQPQKIDADFMAIDAALRTLLYSAEYSVLVPELITRGAAGDLAPLFATSLRIVGDLGQGMNIGLQLSVVCAEDRDRIDAAERAKVATTSSAAQVLERIDRACGQWPKGTVPADFFQPTTSSLPVLLFSGGLDPVTPSSNGELAAKTLSASTHIIAPGYGHLVSPHACAPRLVARFIEDGNASNLQEDCVKALKASKRPPFFVNRLELKP
jgi:pimeloyl-ACP methyl ester carboxylesterase